MGSSTSSANGEHDLAVAFMRPVTAVDTNRDGSLIAVGNRDRALQVWTAGDALMGDAYPGVDLALALSEDGRFASCRQGGGCKCYRPDELLWRIGSRATSSPLMYPAGGGCSSGTADRTIRLFGGECYALVFSAGAPGGRLPSRKQITYCECSDQALAGPPSSVPARLGSELPDTPTWRAESNRRASCHRGGRGRVPPPAPVIRGRHPHRHLFYTSRLEPRPGDQKVDAGSSGSDADGRRSEKEAGRGTSRRGAIRGQRDRYRLQPGSS